MARTKWSLLKAAHVSPDPSTKYGEEVEEGTPRWFRLEITWLFFLRKMMGKVSPYVQSVPICTKFKCRWAHLAGEGMRSVF